MANTAKEQIWKEQIGKELRHQRLRDNYHVNIHNLDPLCTKPSQTHWAGGNGCGVDCKKRVANEKEQKAVDELVRLIHQQEVSPKERYDYPMTTSQEVGWDVDEAEETWDPRRIMTSQVEKVSKYAETYIASHGHSPFTKMPSS